MAKDQPKEKKLEPIEVVFWQSDKGNEPVRDWLREMPKEDRKKMGEDLTTLQFGWPIGMPLCRPLKGGVSEMRSKLPSKRFARVLLTFFDGALVLLHGFFKKTNKTPKADLDLATTRKKTLD